VTSHGADHKITHSFPGTYPQVFDELDRLTWVTHPGGKVVAYGYDAVGNRTSLTYPDGKKLDYSANNPSVLRAQSTNGSISGRVTDPSHAVIAGANVAAVNAGTNFRYETTTNNSGEYYLTNLPLQRNLRCKGL
jgi:YD repeat-containing protein